MRVLFLGTPDFGIKALEKLLESSHDLIAVVTQPDRINSRNNQVIYTPIKQFAIAHGIKVLQFEKISRDGVEPLKQLEADIMVTAAYGQILSQEILDICKFGVINIHASILPKYRGASPIQAALLNGDEEIGVSIMQTVYEVDAGDVIKIKKIKLEGHENAGECFDLLSEIGATALIEALDEIESGTAVYSKQEHNKASFSKKITKEEGHINFGDRVVSIINKVRAYSPWPTAYAFSPKERVIIERASISNSSVTAPIGTVIDSNNRLLIQCSDGVISIDRIKGQGSKSMEIASYLRGKPIEVGSVFK